MNWAQISGDDSIAAIYDTKPEMHPDIEFVDVSGLDVEIGDILDRSSMTFSPPAWKGVQDDSIGAPVDDADAETPA